MVVPVDSCFLPHTNTHTHTRTHAHTHTPSPWIVSMMIGAKAAELIAQDHGLIKPTSPHTSRQQLQPQQKKEKGEKGEPLQALGLGFKLATSPSPISSPISSRL